MSDDARDFDNIEMRAVIKFIFFLKQRTEGNSRHSDRNISLFPSWSGKGLISTPGEVATFHVYIVNNAGAPQLSVFALNGS